MLTDSNERSGVASESDMSIESNNFADIVFDLTERFDDATCKKKIKQYIAAGVNVNQQDEDGDTALHIATQVGFIETIKLLVEHGAKLEILGAARNTAETIARCERHTNVLEYLKSVKSRRQTTPLDAKKETKKSIKQSFADGEYKEVEKRSLEVLAKLKSTYPEIDETNFGATDETLAIYYNLGSSQLMLGDYGQAYKNLARAWEIAETLGYPPLEKYADKLAKAKKLLESQPEDDGQSTTLSTASTDTSLTDTSLSDISSQTSSVMPESTPETITFFAPAEPKIDTSKIKAHHQKGLELAQEKSYNAADKQFKEALVLFVHIFLSQEPAPTTDLDAWILKHLDNVYIADISDYHLTLLVKILIVYVDNIWNCEKEKSNAVVNSVIDYIAEYAKHLQVIAGENKTFTRQQLLGEKEKIYELIIALDERNFAEIKRLIKNYPELVDSDLLLNCNPLMFIAPCNYLDIAELLMRANSKVDAKSTWGGSTALHIAARHNQLQFIEFLLQHGADKEITDDQGNTPLIVAILFGHKPAISLLIKAGARTDIKDKYGNTIFAICCTNPPFLRWLQAQIRFHKKTKSKPQTKTVTVTVENSSQSIDKFDLFDDEDKKESTKDKKSNESKSIISWDHFYYEGAEHARNQHYQEAALSFLNAIAAWKKEEWPDYAEAPATLTKENAKKIKWLYIIFVKLGETCRLQGDYTQAIEFMTKACSLYPKLKKALPPNQFSAEAPMSPVVAELLQAITTADLVQIDRSLATDIENLNQITGKDGCTPLMLAVTEEKRADEKEDQNEVFCHLVTSRKFQLSSVDADGRNILHYVVQRGRADLVYYLLHESASCGYLNLNAKDGRGKTALDYAVEGKHDEIISLLTAKLEKPKNKNASKTLFKKIIVEANTLITTFKERITEKDHYAYFAKFQIKVDQLKEILAGEKNSNAAWALINIYKCMGKLNEAEQQATLLLDFIKENEKVGLQYMLFLLHIKMKKYHLALTEAENLQQSPEYQIAVLQNMVLLYDFVHEHKKMQGTCDQLLVLNPNDEFAVGGLADLNLKRGKVHAAELFYDRVKLEDASTEFITKKATFYLGQKRYNEAEDLLTRNCTAGREEVWQLLGLARVYEHRAENSEDAAQYDTHVQTARGYFQQLLKIDPISHINWQAYAVFCSKTGKNSEAVNLFLKFIDNNQYDESAYVNLIKHFLRVGNNREAVKWYQNATQVFVDSDRAAIVLINGYIGHGRYNKAIQFCKQLLKNSLEQEIHSRPRLEKIYKSLIKAYLLNNQLAAALDIRIKFIALHPENSKGIAGVDKLFRSCGHGAELKAPSAPPNPAMIPGSKPKRSVFFTVKRDNEIKRVNSGEEKFTAIKFPVDCITNLEKLAGKICIVGDAVVQQYLGQDIKSIDKLAFSVCMGPAEFKKLFPQAIQCKYPGREPLMQIRMVKGNNIINMNFWCDEKSELASIADAHKRDFTIDSLQKYPDGTLLDPTGCGKKDLKEGVIRLLTDELTPANEKMIQSDKKIAARLQADPALMLRTVYYAVQYDFNIAENLQAGIMRSDKSWLAKLAVPQYSSLNRKHFLSGKAANYFNKLEELNLLENLFPSATMTNAPRNWDWVKSQLKDFDQRIAEKGQNFNPHEEINEVYYIFTANELVNRGYDTAVRSSTIKEMLNEYKFKPNAEPDKIILMVRLFMTAKLRCDPYCRSLINAAKNRALSPPVTTR